MIHHILHVLAHLVGLDNPSGAPYLSLSGWVNDVIGLIGDLSVVGGVTIYLTHRNCHVRHCWRRGRHPLAGTPFSLCRVHHPEVPNKGPTVEHIEELVRNGDGG